MKTVMPDVDAGFLGEPQILGEYEGFEVYAMPVFARFRTSDPEATARWYVEALGFGVMYTGPELDGVVSLVHLRRRKYQDILLVAGPEGRGEIHLDATGELDALADRSVSLADHAGAVDTPYGPRELHITDPAGNLIVFFAAPDKPTASIDEAMQKAVDRMSQTRDG